MGVWWLAGMLVCLLARVSTQTKPRVSRIHAYQTYYDILYQTCTCDIDCPWNNKAHKLIDFYALFHTEDELKALNRLLCHNQICHYPMPANDTGETTEEPTSTVAPTQASTQAPSTTLSSVTLVSQSNPGVDGCTLLENSDGGRCCTTCWTHILNDTVYNPLTGQTRYVVHMDWLSPPLYQYIPVGRCGSAGQCTGTCVQEFVTHYLLVADQDPSVNPSVPIFFEAVELPAYCKCTGATALLGSPLASLREETSTSSSSSSSSSSSDSSSSSNGGVVLIPVLNSDSDSDSDSGTGTASSTDSGLEVEMAPLTDYETEAAREMTSTSALDGADYSEGLRRRRRRRRRKRQSETRR